MTEFQLEQWGTAEEGLHQETTEMKIGRPKLPAAGPAVSLLTPQAAMGRVYKSIFVLLGSCQVSPPVPGHMG